MVKVVVKKSSVCALFSILLIATYPINYPIALSLRPVDFIFILFAVWAAFNHSVRTRYLYISISIFYILYFLSTIYGVFFIGIVTPRNFAFIYKYSVLFICVWLFVSSQFNKRQVKFLLKTLFFSFLVIIIFEYIILYKFIVITPKLIRFFRPHFPFTDPYFKDSHLLAAYISTGLLAIILCKRYHLLKINLLPYGILVTIVFLAMLLTGSRNGIITFVMTLFAFNFYLLFRKFNVQQNLVRIKRPTLYLAFIVLISATVILGLYMKHGPENDLATRLLKRAFYFDPSEDQSYLGRVRKFIIAYNLVFDGPILIGIGLQSSPLPFFDGAIASILVSTGLTGLFVFAAIIYLFFANLYAKAVQNERKEEFLICFFVSMNYILANLITEFFLVSRSVIPFAIFLGLTTRLVHIPKVAVADGNRTNEGLDHNCLLQYRRDD